MVWSWDSQLASDPPQHGDLVPHPPPPRPCAALEAYAAEREEEGTVRNLGPPCGGRRAGGARTPANFGTKQRGNTACKWDGFRGFRGFRR